MVSADNLYKPDKYKVFLGEGSSVGFCTVWNEAEAAIRACPDLIKKSAIIGTLYSRQGVNVILRNLALNPHIAYLYLWDHGTLSCSPFGVSGKDILKKIWKNGVSDAHEVSETDFKIEKEIDPHIVNLMRKHIKLISVDNPNLDEIVGQFPDAKNADYMDSVRFPDPVPEPIEVFPSEKVGFLVRDKTIVGTWLKALDRIMRYGAIKGTQYGTEQRELIGLTWVIENEEPDRPFMDVDWPDTLRKTVGLNEDAINHYRSIFLSSETPVGVAYTYGNRLMRYPYSDTVDQIKDVMLKELRDSKDTRRAVATTMAPWIDKDSKEPPCITQIQALYTNNKLHLLVTARSHDIFKAAIPNAFGLRSLQSHIAKEAGMEIGSLQIASQSAHIYEQDWRDAKKLLACSIWDRPPELTFDPNTSADPRGMFVLSAKDGALHACFKTPSGDDLISVTGKTANEVAKKIAQLELISRSDHLLDIGSELQKAEIALACGIQYTQDKQLELNLR